MIFMLLDESRRIFQGLRSPWMTWFCNCLSTWAIWWQICIFWESLRFRFMLAYDRSQRILFEIRYRLQYQSSSLDTPTSACSIAQKLYLKIPLMFLLYTELVLRSISTAHEFSICSSILTAIFWHYPTLHTQTDPSVPLPRKLFLFVYQ